MRFPIFYNSWVAKAILFTGYSAIMLFCLIFTKHDKDYYTYNLAAKKRFERFKKHEFTHCKQWLECALLGVIVAVPTLLLKASDSSWWYLILILPLVWFYVQYGIEWIVSCIHHFFSKRKKDISDANYKAYKASAFEMEAVYYEDKEWEEVDKRKVFSFGFIKFYGTI